MTNNKGKEKKEVSANPRAYNSEIETADTAKDFIFFLGNVPLNLIRFLI